MVVLLCAGVRVTPVEVWSVVCRAGQGRAGQGKGEGVACSALWCAVCTQGEWCTPRLRAPIRSAGDCEWLRCSRCCLLISACVASLHPGLQDETGLIAKRFEFDNVFTPASTQEEVFAEVRCRVDVLCRNLRVLPCHGILCLSFMCPPHACYDRCCPL